MNAFGYLRVMFTVEDIDEMLTRLRKRGAQLVGDVVQYEDSYQLIFDEIRHRGCKHLRYLAE